MNYSRTNKYLAAITPDPAAGKLFCNLAAKLSGMGEMYRCFFYTCLLYTSNEAVTEMNGVEHQFTEEEKNFVVQFAFRSGSKEDAETVATIIKSISSGCKFAFSSASFAAIDAIVTVVSSSTI